MTITLMEGSETLYPFQNDLDWGCRPKSTKMKVHQRYVGRYTIEDAMNIQSIGYRTKTFEARNLAFFFLISLGFQLLVGLPTYTGFLHTPQGFSDPVLIPWILLNIPVLLGPSTAAFVVAGLTEGKPGVKELMKDQPTFFDFAAEVGLTKHIGGIEATEALIELCHIGRESTILDVGCGVGATACFIATKVGCRVVGVDILEKMVERSRERASRQKLTHRVEFKVADAQKLPFEDSLFDAVLTESVTAFPADKQKAVSEYARVTKPGGYVGLNETAWLKAPPSPEVIAWAAQEVGTSVKPLTSDEWIGLLDTGYLSDGKNEADIR